MESADRLGVLSCVPAFEGLGHAEIRAIAERTEVRPFIAGEALIRQDEPGDSLWVLASGAAIVQLRRRDGDTLELARVGPGDVVGEMALVTGAPRNADIVASKDGEALVLPRTAFEEIAAVHPGVVSVLTELVARRLGRAAQDGLGDKVLKGYRILRPAGRGATAVVYEAEPEGAPAGAGLRLALKMLSHRFCRDRAAMEWFEREARVLDSVRHEGVARSYGRFQAYGTCFLVMEFLDGPSVHEMTKRLGRLDAPDALAIAGSVASALGHCHALGVVHGDVKPANVVVELGGRVVLTDFGIASRVETGAAQPVDTVRISGTPQYMAPELFVGARPSPSSDLYALGCLLFELLEGREAFPATDLGTLVLAKRRFLSAPTTRPDTPPAIRDLVDRLLQPEPARRPSVAAELGLEPGRVSAATIEATLRLRSAAAATAAGDPVPTVRRTAT